MNLFQKNKYFIDDESLSLIQTFGGSKGGASDGEESSSSGGIMDTIVDLAKKKYATNPFSA